jgi:hypothetical protein
MEPDTLRFALARAGGLWLVAYGGRNMCLMSRLCRAYLALSLAGETEDGSRTMPLARFGAFEVRLIELAGRRMTEESDFWIELYRHDIQSSLDSCRCQDIDEAEPIAEYLVACAKGLYESWHSRLCQVSQQ